MLRTTELGTDSVCTQKLEMRRELQDNEHNFQGITIS